MLATCLILATTTLGVDTGWQPTDDGSLEYIIQIDRQLLASMLDGESVVSEIPPEVAGVRRYRIMVGDAELPREGIKPAAEVKQPPVQEPPIQQPPIQQPPVQQPPAEDPLSIPPSVDLPEMPKQYEVPPALDKSADTQIPKTFDPSPSAERQASHISTYKPAEEPATKKKDVSGEAKPWLPLILSLLVLVASLAANFYLVWIWLDARRRYRELALERVAAGAV